ncbi:MAG: T9SS type A sorting domain-containing protein [Bacteroidales bacterium]|nr:T9SS type A sorting domain-containing protein [Bacteroidales bacterium]MCF8455162.1 T9SS type A sorting domain-containing protein [Bacteroidales bacterium]
MERKIRLIKSSSLQTMRKVLFAIFFLFILMPGLFAQSNQYMHFDGVDDHAYLADGSQYMLNSTTLSLTGWFKADQLGYAKGLMGCRGTGGSFHVAQQTNGVIKARFDNSTISTPEFTQIPLVWQHVAFVYDGSSIKLYVDGVVVVSDVASGVLTSPNVPFAIGRNILASYQWYYNGGTDEVALWTVALTQAQIQDIMANEIDVKAPGLQLYYKFNQGNPGGNNSSITKLISEVGGGTRDADLLNLALSGPTSNFIGTLNTGYQAISFQPIPNKLVTDAPFLLNATATSALPVTLEIVSGPATVSGNTITLSGLAGQVVVKASQPGDTTYNPAVDVVNSFMVIDPAVNVPTIEARSPLEADVYVPVLKPIQLATIVGIGYPELFFVDDVSFTIDGTTVPATHWGNGYYTAWWEPTAYGSYSLVINADNNFGSTATKSVSINIVQAVTNMNVQAVEGVWLSMNNPSEVVEVELPSYLGAFNQIIATLNVHCPAGGCGEWDRIASIDARGHNGKWIEIIRYITPYGVACDHSIDLTDYMSILQGKVSIRLNCGTLDNGYMYDLSFEYKAGTPDHCYSNVDVIWQDTYPFGDYANLQPVPMQSRTFPASTQAAKLKVMNTGHGWGDLNTGNAAEFYEATHTLKFNSDPVSQHLWATCNPNPDGCQPQSGTWYHSRAGWCPGAISLVFDYDLSQYITSGSVNMEYKFYDGYVDLCHPNHPDCVTNVTCSDCDNGYNPHYIIAANLVTYFDSYFDPVEIDEPNISNVDVQVFPNPAVGKFMLSSNGDFMKSHVEIFDILGHKIDSFDWDGKSQWVDMTGAKKGVYFVQIKINEKVKSKRIVLQ